MITDAERQQIEDRVNREYARSLAKHGNWDNLSFDDMLAKVFDEAEEVDNAVFSGDYHGEHGTLNELAQVIVCCQKMMVQIMRRKGC